MSRSSANGTRRTIVRWAVLIAVLSLGYVTEHFGIPQDHWIVIVALGVMYLAIGETQAKLGRIERRLGLEHLQTEWEQAVEMADEPMPPEHSVPELPPGDDPHISPGTRLFMEHFERFADVVNEHLGIWDLRETAERDYGDREYCRRYNIFRMNKRCGIAKVYDRDFLGFPYTAETPSITTVIEIQNARSFRVDELMQFLDWLALAGSFREEVARVRQEIRNAMVLAMWQVGPDRIVKPTTLRVAFNASAEWYLDVTGVFPRDHREFDSLRDIRRNAEEGNSLQ